MGMGGTERMRQAREDLHGGRGRVPLRVVGVVGLVGVWLLWAMGLLAWRMEALATGTSATSPRQERAVMGMPHHKGRKRKLSKRPST